MDICARTMACARTATAAAVPRSAAPRAWLRRCSSLPIAIHRSFAACRRQPRNQPAHRLAAMGKRVLPRKRQLGARQAGEIVLKVRVISEAAAAAWRIDDRPAPDAFGDDRFGILGMAQQDEHAVVMRAPIVD